MSILTIVCKYIYCFAYNLNASHSLYKKISLKNSCLTSPIPVFRTRIFFDIKKIFNLSSEIASTVLKEAVLT